VCLDPCSPPAGAPPPTAAAAEPPAEELLGGGGGGWWGWGWGRGASAPPFFAAGVPRGGSLEGDDDNVDVAAAAAAAGALLPALPPRRALFPAHRMVTYRSRLAAICHDALGGPAWVKGALASPAAAAAAALPRLLPALPHPADVAATQLLAPGLFPLRAEASLVDSLPALPASLPDESAAAESAAPAAGGGGRARGWPWPWGGLFRGRSGGGEEGPLLEVLLRVEGRGLCNVTGGWVSGAAVDGAGRAAPSPVDIVARPEAPPPWVAMRAPLHPLLAPAAALASWLALAAGWAALLRRLQPAGRGDYLVARVRLPAGAVRGAAAAGRDPLAAAVGEGARLLVHLETDFAVVSLPLDIRIGCAAPGGEDAEGGGMPRRRRRRGGVGPRGPPARRLQGCLAVFEAAQRAAGLEPRSVTPGGGGGSAGRRWPPLFECFF
jgi:hypothetical protein